MHSSAQLRGHEPPSSNVFVRFSFFRNVIASQPRRARKGREREITATYYLQSQRLQKKKAYITNHIFFPTSSSCFFSFSTVEAIGILSRQCDPSVLIQAAGPSSSDSKAQHRLQNIDPLLLTFRDTSIESACSRTRFGGTST